MATSLSIKGKTQGNEAVTSTINYVNPNATNAQLVSLATAMNNLTTNTVADITRIDKNSLTNTIEKLDRNLQVSPATVNTAQISTNPNSPTEVTLTGTDISSTDLRVTKPQENNVFIFVDWVQVEGNITIALVGDSLSDATSTDIVFEFPETETYKAASVTLHLNKE